MIKENVEVEDREYDCEGPKENGQDAKKKGKMRGDRE